MRSDAQDRWGRTRISSKPPISEKKRLEALRALEQEQQIREWHSRQVEINRARPRWKLPEPKA